MRGQFGAAVVVGVGGALGTLGRHGLNLVPGASGEPYGTSLANILGSLLLGTLVGWASRRAFRSRWVGSGLGTGFCGGLTTMSTFVADSVALSACSVAAMAGYLVVSLGGGLLATVLGYEAGRRLAGGDLHEPAEG